MKYPSLFVVATRKRGQNRWSISGFRPYARKTTADKAAKAYREKHGSEYEYRVLEYAAIAQATGEESN